MYYIYSSLFLGFLFFGGSLLTTDETKRVGAIVIANVWFGVSLLLGQLT